MCTNFVLNHQPKSKNLKNKKQNFKIFMIFWIIKFYLVLEDKDRKTRLCNRLYKRHVGQST